MTQQRKKANDLKIQKSFKDVNSIFQGESAEQRTQREGRARIERASKLRDQADQVTRGASGGKKV
jgi:hypothetical protein